MPWLPDPDAPAPNGDPHEPLPRPLPDEPEDPDHPWNGTDDGHDCADCALGSIWRCDPAAHVWDGRDPMALLRVVERAELVRFLDEMARMRWQGRTDQVLP